MDAEADSLLESIRDTAFAVYRTEPTGAALSALVAKYPADDREALAERMRLLYYSTRSWRVAQHLAMLHLDMLTPYTGFIDSVRALLFADYALQDSGGHPLARLIHARVSWVRRVPWAVIHQCEKISAADELVASLPPQQRAMLKRDALSLHAMALAYLNAPKEALGLMMAVEDFGLSVEALCQLVMASRDEPIAAVWAARRLATIEGLGGITAAKVLRALRIGLVQVLKARQVCR